MWWKEETNPDYIESQKVMLKIMIPILIPLAVFILWYSYPWLSVDEKLVRDAPSLTIFGKVDSIYKDAKNHNIKVYYFSNGERYQFFSEIGIKLNVKDSISKSAGSMQVNIFRGNGKKETINYKDILIERLN